jgi:hypothetical protein
VNFQHLASNMWDMPRYSLKSKESRSYLKPQGAPYWQEIDTGLHLRVSEEQERRCVVRSQAHKRQVLVSHFDSLAK